jgi:hypothetical protein
MTRRLFAKHAAVERISRPGRPDRLAHPFQVAPPAPPPPPKVELPPLRRPSFRPKGTRRWSALISLGIHLGLLSSALLVGGRWLVKEFTQEPPMQPTLTAAVSPAPRPVRVALPPNLRPTDGLPRGATWVQEAAVPGISAARFRAQGLPLSIQSVGLRVGPGAKFSPSTLDRATLAGQFLGKPVLWYLTQQESDGVALEAISYYEPQTFQEDGVIHLLVRAASLDEAKAVAQALAGVRLRSDAAAGKPAQP